MKRFSFIFITLLTVNVCSMAQGNVGIGTTSPTAKLHLRGTQKIDSTYTLEFGGGLSGKEINAGKMGYKAFSPDAFDIVGAGSGAGNRRIKLWDKIIVPDSAFFNGHSRFNGNINVLNDGSIGIGTEYPTQRLDVTGRIRIRQLNYLTAGVSFDSDQNNGGFVGMRNDGQMGFYGNSGGGWGLIMNTTNGNVGIGITTTPTEKLHIGANAKMDGTHTFEFGAGLPKELQAGKIGYKFLSTDALDIVGAGYSEHVRKIKFWNQIIVPDTSFFFGKLMCNEKVNLYDTVNIFGKKPIEFGAGVVGKEINAGKIGYQTFTAGALDIVGAGTTPSNRKVKIHAEGGLYIAGQITSEDWIPLDLMWFWVNYGGEFAPAAYFKDELGMVHLTGLIKDGYFTPGTVIAHLPVGYRPPYFTLIFAVVNGLNTTGRVDVKPNGDVVFQGTTNTFLSLDQVYFRTN